MKESEIPKGFEFVQTYYSDGYKTNQYNKGLITWEFTYLNGKLVTSDGFIEEVNGISLTARQLKQLDKILTSK